MDRSKCRSQRGLAHYLGSNAEVAKMQVQDIYLLGINVELVIMEYC